MNGIQEVRGSIFFGFIIIFKGLVGFRLAFFSFKLPISYYRMQYLLGYGGMFRNELIVRLVCVNRIDVEYG